MRGDFGIYLNFVNGNHYQAVFSVAQQMPPLPVLQPMSTVASTPIVIPNLLSQYVRTVAVSSNVNAMSASKLATVFSSASLLFPQNRPRGRPPKNPRMVLYIICNYFLTLYFQKLYIYVLQFIVFVANLPTVAVSSSAVVMVPSTLASVFSSASFISPQKRPRGRPPKQPRIQFRYLL